MKNQIRWEIVFLIVIILVIGLGNRVFWQKSAKFEALGAELKDSIPPVLKASQNPNFDNPDQIKRNLSEITKAYIYRTALASDIDPEMAIWIAGHESQFDPNVIGDSDREKCWQGKNKGKIQRARGVWQINDCFWPEITDKQAIDLVWSTDWAMKQMKINPNIWSVYHFCWKWYDDCPF